MIIIEKKIGTHLLYQMNYLRSFSEAMDNLKSLSEITSCLDEKISGIISENSDSKMNFEQSLQIYEK